METYLPRYCEDRSTFCCRSSLVYQRLFGPQGNPSFRGRCHRSDSSDGAMIPSQDCVGSDCLPNVSL